MIHDLKIHPQYFSRVISGEKTAELRYNDRDYQVGDEIILKEWNACCFTGNNIYVRITHILSGICGLKKNWCILSFQRLDDGK